jgi:hypothetical protein
MRPPLGKRANEGKLRAGRNFMDFALVEHHDPWAFSEPRCTKAALAARLSKSGAGLRRIIGGTVRIA